MTWATAREPFSTALEYQPSPATTLEILKRSSSDASIDHEGDWPRRGRSVCRDPRFANPLACAESRSSRTDTFVELISKPIGKRISRSSTLHDDSEHCSAVLDDDLLEPCPHLPQPAPFSEILDDMGGPYTGYSRRNAHPIPNRQPASTTSSIAQKVPAELLHQVYHYLAPADFHSARHTCRSWFISSLEKSLLEIMCKRAGISSSVKTELAKQVAQSRTSRPYNDEWVVSKMLSRECALGPHWKGNGLKSNHSWTPAFCHTATVDFTEVGVQNESDGLTGNSFTISDCGHFLMVANGCLLYIYEINKIKGDELNNVESPGNLLPVASIICPARILLCSMDTSCSRYAVALLLDGRVGMVCEIKSLKSNKRKSSTATKESLRNSGVSFLDRVTLKSSGDAEQASEQPFIFPGIATTSHKAEYQWQVGNFQVTEPSSRQGSISRGSVLSQSRPDKTPMKQISGDYRSASSVPVENGPRSLYRNICSDEDPPRSVSIFLSTSSFSLYLLLPNLAYFNKQAI